MTGAPAARTHPWNPGFVWEDHVGPFRHLTDEQVADFDRLGAVVVDGIVDDVLFSRLVEDLDALEAEADAMLRATADGRVSIAETGAITFTLFAATRSTAARELATSPVMLEVCADLIGPDVDLYWDQAVYKKPEKPRRFPWHQDNGYTYVEPQQYLTVWLALTDATVDHGCPWVVPGLHRSGTLAHTWVEPLGWECLEDPEGAVAVEVPAGAAVVFSSLTPHMTGPNTTDDVRKAYIVQYAPPGAEILEGDPSAGPPTGRRRADAADHVFPVLRDGRPAPPLDV